MMKPTTIQVKLLFTLFFLYIVQSVHSTPFPYQSNDSNYQSPSASLGGNGGDSQAQPPVPMVNSAQVPISTSAGIMTSPSAPLQNSASSLSTPSNLGVSTSNDPGIPTLTASNQGTALTKPVPLAYDAVSFGVSLRPLPIYQKGIFAFILVGFTTVLLGLFM